MHRNNKKFLFIIDNLSSGGAQRQLINLAVGLKQKGYEVEFFCYAAGDLLAQPLYDHGIRIHHFEKKGRFSLDVVAKIRSLLQREEYDLLLSFLTTPNFYNLITGKLPFSRVPVIVSERFCDLPGRVSWIDRGVRQMYRLADHVIVNSHHQGENFLTKYPWLKNRISTIYNGYDLSLLPAAEKEPDNNPLKILTIASVSPYKNGLCLAEALQILRDDYHITPVVDWIGQLFTTEEFGGYLAKVKQKIAEYGLGDQWNWLGQRKDIVDQLHQHDVMVHPSYGEGLPNVVCEALACGRPVIVSDTLDHPRLVQHGQSGLLFDYRDPRDLAEKIAQFSSLSVAERRRMGEAGREYAQKNLSIDRFVQEYEKLFNTVMER